MKPQFERYKYNVLVEWETGEKAHEPLPVLAEDDPVTGASFTMGNGISHLDGSKRFTNLAKRDKPDFLYSFTKRGDQNFF